VSMHGCDEGPVRHLSVGPLAWLCGAILRSVAAASEAPSRSESWYQPTRINPAFRHAASESTAAVAARIAEMSTRCRSVWMWDMVLVTATTAPRDAVREGGTRLASDEKGIDHGQEVAGSAE